MGPFAETTEQLGDFFLVDVPNLDEAMSIAARLPAAKKRTIEVRPVFHLEGLPPDQFSVVPTSSERSGSRYMLLCYDNEVEWKKLGDDALAAAQAEAVVLTHQLAQRGQYISASPLHSASTATSVRIREGIRVITDGPFVETNEFLGGYYMIFVRDLNDAITVASKHPGARIGTVEVRKLVQLPQP